MAVNPVDPQADGLWPAVPPPGPPRAGAAETYGGVVEDAVDGAFAVLAVAAALVRYAADSVVRSRPGVLARLTSPGHRSLLRRTLRAPAQVLAHPASAVLRVLTAAADELVPEVTRAVLARLDIPGLVAEFVDLDRLAERLDVDAVVARADLDAVLARVDVDAVVARVDLDAVLARVDVDAIVAKVDLDAVAARLDLDPLVDKVDVSRVLDRVDLDAVVARVDLDAAAARLDLDPLVDKVDVSRVLDRVDSVDLDAVVAKVDVDAVVAKVDVDAVVAKADLDRAVDRVDVDRVIARADVAGLARYVVEVIDLPGLLRSSTGSVTSEMVRSVRDQGADADRAVERIVDRLLHRQGRRTATADPGPGQSGAAHDDG